MNAETSAAPKKKILVVDDNEVILKILCSKCESNYYSIGSKCVKCYPSFRYLVPISMFIGIVFVFSNAISKFKRNMRHLQLESVCFGFNWYPF